MKKKILFLLLALTLSFAAVGECARNYFEKNSPHAVSYSTFFSDLPVEMTMVNYAKDDGTNEYWVKIILRANKTAMFYYANLDVDGEKYVLNCVEEPTAKYLYTATSALDQYDASRFPALGDIERTNARYFKLEPDLLEKILNAKKVVITYDTNEYEGKQGTFKREGLAMFKKLAGLKYQDFSDYWPVQKNK